MQGTKYVIMWIMTIQKMVLPVGVLLPKCYPPFKSLEVKEDSVINVFCNIWGPI